MLGKNCWVKATPLVAVATVALAGCGEATKTNSGSGSGTQGGTLVVALSNKVDSLDPQTAISLQASEVFPNIFESLVSVTPKGTIAPGVAKSYEYDPAGKRLSFTLDPAAKFSNGTPLTSADVAFSVKVWQKGEIYGSYYTSIASVSTPSPQEVVMKLSAPNAGLLGVLATSNASVYPKGYAGKSAKEFWKAPIGSGPFKIASAKLATQIDLTRNTSYRVKGLPHFDKLTMRVISDANQRLLQFKAGKLDIVNRVAGDVALQYPQDKLQSVLGSSLDVLIANTKSPAVKSPELRQAISKALDRPKLVKGAFSDFAEVPKTVEHQIIPGVQPCSECDYGTRDVAGAKALLAQAGYDGKPIELLVSATGGLDLLAAQAMEPMLAEAGIKIKVTPVETSTLLDRLQKGDYELGTTDYSALGPSPLDPLGFLGSTNYLFSGGATGAVKKALAGVEGATDAAGMQEATSAMEQDAYTNAPVIPVAALKVVWAVSDRVKGFAPPAFQVYSTANLSAGG